MNHVGSLTIMQALDIMDSGLPFNIGFVTANVEQQTGGEIKRYENATVANVGFNPNASGGRRNPNNDLHGTKTILKTNGEKRSVHKLLIIELNNHRVLL